MSLGWRGKIKSDLKPGVIINTSQEGGIKDEGNLIREP